MGRCISGAQGAGKAHERRTEHSQNSSLPQKSRRKRRTILRLHSATLIQRLNAESARRKAQKRRTKGAQNIHKTHDFLTSGCVSEKLICSSPSLRCFDGGSWNPRSAMRTKGARKAHRTFTKLTASPQGVALAECVSEIDLRCAARKAGRRTSAAQGAQKAHKRRTTHSQKS